MEGQDLFDLAQGEAHVPSVLYEPQPAPVLFPVDAVTGLRALRGWKQSDAFVVPDRLGVHTRPLRKYPDPYPLHSYLPG